MSDQAANDGAASTGSHDDDSTISSISAADVQVKIFNWLAAWLTLYDQKVFLRDKVEGIQAAGPLVSNVDHAEAITDSNTVEINVLCAQTSLND